MHTGLEMLAVFFRRVDDSVSRTLISVHRVLLRVLKHRLCVHSNRYQESVIRQFWAIHPKTWFRAMLCYAYTPRNARDWSITPSFTPSLQSWVWIKIFSCSISTAEFQKYFSNMQSIGKKTFFPNFLVPITKTNNIIVSSSPVYPSNRHNPPPHLSAIFPLVSTLLCGGAWRHMHACIHDSRHLPWEI